jgi:hypothetical protein
MVKPMATRKQKAPLKGPRGGETTVSKSGMVRKTLWLHGDEAEALRLRAFKERRAESEIVREALRRLLEIED